MMDEDWEENQGVDTIRETPLGACIGATIVDITATDKQDFLDGETPMVYFHLSNGETIFVVHHDGVLGTL